MATAVRQTMDAGKRRGGRRSRFSAEERKHLVDRAMLRLADGVSLEQSAKEIGVSYETLRRWRMDVGGASRLRPVTVKTARASRSEAAPPAARLITASGHRIEGLDIDTLVELVRRLG